MNIELYIEHPVTKRWEPIDLFSEESININFKLKDLNDISKVFSTYSQDFTVPASSNNNKAFNYFFDTKLVRVRNRGLNAKIFINDALFRTGQIVIREGQVENFKLLNYKVEFRTTIAQLKEKVGEDTIANVIGKRLNDYYSLQWDAQSIYNRIVWSNGTEDILVPLVSNTRVWSHGDGGDNDIKEASKGISKYELRPAINMRVILDLLIEYYDLNVDFPVKNTDAFKKLYLWLNGKSEEGEQPPVTYEFKYTQPWVLDSGGIPPNEKTFFNVTTDNGGMKITDTGYDYSLGRNYSISHTLGSIINADDGTPYTGRIVTVVTERGTNNVVTHESSDVDGAAIIYYRISQERPNVERIYDISFIFDNPVDIGYVNTMVQVLHYLGSGLPSNRMRSNNNNLPSTHQNFDIKYALGEWKVIDFFSSIFKMFNIRVIEDFNNMSMSWLTPAEFYSNFKTLDINKYTDIIKYTIQPSTNYKQIEFKHTDENYFRNVEYKKLVNKAYGSEVYKSDDKALTESYQVETKFSIMNWFLLNGTSIKTSYGFSSPGSPQEPSVPTIMYVQGSEFIITDDNTLDADIRFKIPQAGNPSFTTQLTKYVKFGNQDSLNLDTYTNSITFDIDIEPTNNSPMLKSLYNNYYKVDIERLYQPNSNYYTFEGYFSLNGVLDFDMRNRLIIEDNLYTIEEASIDITTGKFKMKLLNVLNEFTSDYPIPMTPIIFFANGGILKMNGAVNTGGATTEEISHYQIQYRRQGTNTWIDGLNLTYVPFVSQTWNINPVTPAGIYDVRCRTVAPAPNPNVSDWVYVYNVSVIDSIAFQPIDGVISEEIAITRPPCLRFPPVVSDTLPNNRKVFFPVEDMTLITNGTKVYLDEELTMPYIPRSVASLPVLSDDGYSSYNLTIDLEGVIKEINPCLPIPVKIIVGDVAFDSVERMTLSTWAEIPKLTLYNNNAFKLGGKFFEDEDAQKSADIDRFNGKYMMVKFDDGKEVEDTITNVRYLKIDDSVISEIPLPLTK